MMSETAEHAGSGLRFEEAEIATYEPEQPFDLIFSNAALQWLPNHETLFPRLAGWLTPGGQLAMQMPANFSHPSHRTAAELAQVAPFAEALDGWVRHDPVLGPEQYAVLHLVRPGITSPATLVYSDEESMLPAEGTEEYYVRKVLPAKLALDLEWLRDRSLLGDLELLTRTALRVLRVRRSVEPLRVGLSGAVRLG